MTDNIPLILNCSMPRSGSTLLQNLLAQNPSHHCTSTNGLLDMLMTVRDRWMQCAEFVAQGLRNIEPRIRGGMREFIAGFYAGELAEGKTIFDKSRGWLHSLPLIESILGRQVKVIVAVRDVRDVLSSFEKIYRRSTITDHPLQPDQAIQRLTVQGRAERLINPQNIVGYMLASIHGAFEANLQDRLVIVPYRDLTHDPVTTIKRVCFECGIESFDCDPSNVVQSTKEDDTVYGMYDLHNTRPIVEPDEGESWVGILPDTYAAHVDQQFSFIQSLARRTYLKPRREVMAGT